MWYPLYICNCAALHIWMYVVCYSYKINYCAMSSLFYNFGQVGVDYRCCFDTSPSTPHQRPAPYPPPAHFCRIIKAHTRSLQLDVPAHSVVVPSVRKPCSNDRQADRAYSKQCLYYVCNELIVLRVWIKHSDIMRKILHCKLNKRFDNKLHYKKS